MNILVTGHRGFVGSRLFKALKEYGDAEITGLDFKDPKEHLLSCRLPYPIDLIYHLAAYKSVEESWQYPMRYLQNVATTVRLAQEYPEAKIIHASSAATLQLFPSPYGFFKEEASQYLYKFHKNALNLILPNIYGGEQEQNSVVDTFKGKEEVTIHGDGTQVRDYVHVDDIVAALLKAKDWEPGKYFVGTNIGTSVLDLAKHKKKVFAEPRSGGKEPHVSVLPNTTPDWHHTINVMDYIYA